MGICFMDMKLQAMHVEIAEHPRPFGGICENNQADLR